MWIRQSEEAVRDLCQARADQVHEPALAATYAHYRAVLQGRDAQLEGIEADLAVWYDAPPFATPCTA
jgi:hypothetical protein